MKLGVTGRTKRVVNQGQKFQNRVSRRDILMLLKDPRLWRQGWLVVALRSLHSSYLIAQHSVSEAVWSLKKQRAPAHMLSSEFDQGQRCVSGESHNVLTRYCVGKQVEHKSALSVGLL